MAKTNQKTATAKKAVSKPVEKELEVIEFTEETVVDQPQEVELEPTEEVIETAEFENLIGYLAPESNTELVELLKESEVKEEEELYKTSDYTELERVLGREKTLKGDIYYGHKRK